MVYQYKILLIGEPEVGKSSLVRRYVHHAFDERYLATLGTVISGRPERLVLEDGSPVQVNLTIWDVMGQEGSLDLLGQAYFHGARGALAVFDVTRRGTLEGLRKWIEAGLRAEPRMPLVVLGNKSDMETRRQVRDEEVRAFCDSLHLPYYPTSAKTGLNVEAAFKLLCGEVLARFSSVRSV